MVLKFITVVLLISLCFSCISPSSNNSDKAETAKDSLTIEQFYPLLPSGGEFISMIHNVGLDYKVDVINPLKSPYDFMLLRNQALNFGIYLTDLSYLLFFEKQEESILYLYQIQEMATLLGIQNHFDDIFFNNLIANLSNPDSIKAISIEQSTLFVKKMEALGNSQMVLLITTGSLIEAMNIAATVIDESRINDEVISRTIDLAYVFDSFYLQYSKSNSKDNTITHLTSDIQELRNIFTSMAIMQSSKAIRREGKLVLTSELHHDVNKFNVNKMKVMVNTIRTKIVNQVY
jgi:hypothetical protein